MPCSMCTASCTFCGSSLGVAYILLCFRYFDSGASSVYFFETQEDNDDAFGACYLIHKDVEEKKGGLETGWWDSTHVFEVTPDSTKNSFTYKLTSTVMVGVLPSL